MFFKVKSSGILRSKRAIQANLMIMRTFVKLRRFALDNTSLKYDIKELNKDLKELRKQTEGRFQIVFETLDRLLAIDEKPKRKIGF